MFQLYLSILCVISWSFPAAVNVFVFHVPMVMLSLPWIFDNALVACLTPPSWCTAESAVLVGSGSNRSGMVACFHHMVNHRWSATWWSPSLSRSNTWPLSSLWNPSAHLALFFKLWRYPPSDAMLTPAISPITGRLEEGGSVLFLPVKVERTCPLPKINKILISNRHPFYLFVFCVFILEKTGIDNETISIQKSCILKFTT